MPYLLEKSRFGINFFRKKKHYIVVVCVPSFHLSARSSSFFLAFLGATKHLCKRLCPSVGQSVGLLVHWSICRSVRQSICYDLSYRGVLQHLKRSYQTENHNNLFLSQQINIMYNCMCTKFLSLLKNLQFFWHFLMENFLGSVCPSICRSVHRSVTPSHFRQF